MSIEKRPELDKVYKRYDGKYFMVLEVASTLEGQEFVIYRDMADDESFASIALPVTEWEKPVIEDGREKERFVEIDPLTEFGNFS